MNEEKKEKIETIELEESIAVLKTRKIHAGNRLQGFRFQAWILIVFIVAGGLLGYAFSESIKIEKTRSITEDIPAMIIGSILGAFSYVYFTFVIRMAVQNNLRRIDSRLAQLGAEELRENIEENFFTKLVQINFKYIDQYYLQTQEQAAKSFWLATFASISGLIIILIGIFMMYTRSIEPAYVTTGAGIISQFISAIFFFLYNRTILKMSQYHRKLVITQNVSLALKMTDDMDKDSKTKSLELIIDRLTSDVNKYLTDNKD